LCERRLKALGCRPVLYRKDGRLFVTDNGNHILDCEITLIPDATRLDMNIRAIPGVVGTGLFLGMAERVLVGAKDDFRLIDERRGSSLTSHDAPERGDGEQSRLMGTVADGSSESTKGET
jgi:hypothetical protein